MALLTLQCVAYASRFRIVFELRTELSSAELDIIDLRIMYTFFFYKKIIILPEPQFSLTFPEIEPQIFLNFS